MPPPPSPSPPEGGTLQAPYLNQGSSSHSPGSEENGLAAMGGGGGYEMDMNYQQRMAAEFEADFQQFEMEEGEAEERRDPLADPRLRDIVGGGEEEQDGGRNQEEGEMGKEGEEGEVEEEGSGEGDRGGEGRGMNEGDEADVEEGEVSDSSGEGGHGEEVSRGQTGAAWDSIDDFFFLRNTLRVPWLPRGTTS